MFIRDELLHATEELIHVFLKFFVRNWGRAADK